jgi:hypothetical protein
VPAEAGGAAVRVGGRAGRGLATVPGPPADPGPAGGASGEGGAVVPAEPGGSRSVGRGGGGGDGRVRAGVRQLRAGREGRGRTRPASGRRRSERRSPSGGSGTART